MIRVTGTDHHAQAVQAELSWVSDETFAERVCAASRSRPGRLVAMLGRTEIYSARPSAEQLKAANTAASRWLRQRCRALQADGGMILGRFLWAKVDRVTLDEQDLRDLLRDAALEAA